MARPVRALVRLAAPLVASGAVVTTLATCFAIAKARDVYTGGLKWPYFSDMGRDAPGYYVFCVGLTLTALALIATWSFNYEFQRSALRRPRQHGHVGAAVGRTAIACVALGGVSTVGLPVLVRRTDGRRLDAWAAGADLTLLLLLLVSRPSSARRRTPSCTTTRPTGSSASRPSPSSST
jgi:hypothetical protein